MTDEFFADLSGARAIGPTTVLERVVLIPDPTEYRTADCLVAFVALLSWCLCTDHSVLRIDDSAGGVNASRTLPLPLDGATAVADLHRLLAPEIPSTGAIRVRCLDRDAAVVPLGLSVAMSRSGRPDRVSLTVEGRHPHQGRLCDLAGNLATLLGRVRSHTGTLADLDPFDGTQLTAMKSRWQQANPVLPMITVPELIARHAHHRPEAPALTYRGDTISYRALWAEVSELANKLTDRGVRPGDKVAALLGPGPAGVRCFLATMLAGGCHVPVDRRMPQARRDHLLADSGAGYLLDPDAEEPVTETGAPHAPSDPDLAYQLYTSGTTGKPKGIGISHRNLTHLLANPELPLDLRPDDVWTLFHSYSFDFSVWEILGCLATGGRLVVLDAENVMDPSRLRVTLQREGVTVFCHTPSAFARIIAVDERDPLPLPRLRYVIFGGEKLEPPPLLSWRLHHPDVRLINMYGITEATIHATFHELSDEDLCEVRSPIGLPLPGTALYLVDPDTGRRLVPDGAVGEIWLGGTGIAAGYHNLPELTEQRFPTGVLGEDRLLRTGDLARRRLDGRLEYLARADDQFQWHGHRIEPGDIESALREHRLVANAAVVMSGRSGGLIAAFVVARAEADSTGPPTKQQLSEHLRTRLPQYMVPHVFHFVAALPLTDTGKLDRRGLIAIDESGGPDAVSHRPAVQRDRRESDAEQIPAAVARIPVEPLSAVQERIFIADRLAGVPNGYVETLAWRVGGGPIELAALRAALTALTERHRLLRTGFVVDRGRVRAVAGSAWEPAVRVIEVSEPPEFGATLSTPMVPASGRLLEAVVVRARGAEDVLVLHQHHLITDEGSLGPLMDDLDRCYRAARAGAPATQWPGAQYADLPPEPEPEAGALAAATESLAGVPISILPPVHAVAPDGRIAVEVPVARQVLRSACRTYGAPAHTLIAAALALALHRWLETPDITFGSVVSTHAEGAGAAIGPQFDLTVVRSHLGTVGDVVRSVRARIADALDGPPVPYHRLVAGIRSERGAAPYCEVLLSGYGSAAADIPLGAHRLTRLRVPAALRRQGHPIVVTAHDVGAPFDLDLCYQGERVSRAGAEALAACLRDALLTVVGAGEAPRTTEMVAAQQVPTVATILTAGPAAPANGAPRSVPAMLEFAAATAHSAPVVQSRFESAAPESRTGSRDPVRSADLADEIRRSWLDVLDATDLGLDDNFFDVGGDSAKLIAVHAELERLLGREVPIGVLFACPTIRELADHLEAEGPS
ncbi:non-ribosomal peptide synthetase [Nocardia panacis]|nr:non-ribosomal peptide synthetase [Nocardia panacis]